MLPISPTQQDSPDATKKNKARQPCQEVDKCCDANASGVGEVFNHQWQICFGKPRQRWHWILLLGAVVGAATTLTVVGVALAVGWFEAGDEVALRVQPTASLKLAAVGDTLICGDFRKDGAVLYFAVNTTAGLLNLTYSSSKNEKTNGGFLVVVQGGQQATCAWAGSQPPYDLTTWHLVGDSDNTTPAFVKATLAEVLQLPIADLVAQVAPANITHLEQVRQLLEGDLGTALQQLSIKLGASGIIGSPGSTTAASRLHILAWHAALLQGGVVALPAKEVGLVNEFVQQHHMDSSGWQPEKEEESEEEQASSRIDAMNASGTRRLWGRRRRRRSSPSDSWCPTGFPYRACGNSNFGMCGKADSCWRWVCGTCCCHRGCEVHDYYCSCHGLGHTRCLTFIDFFNHGCSTCRR